MAWLRSFVFAGVLLLAGLGMRPAFGAIVTVDVEGVVDSVQLGGGLGLDGSVAIGSVMKGTCVYDTHTRDVIDDIHNGYYIGVSVSMSIGTYSFTDRPMSSRQPYFKIFTVDPVYFVRCPEAAFSGTVLVNGSPMSFDDFTWATKEFRFMDLWASSPQYVPDDALPTSFPDISVFTKRNEFGVGFRDHEDQFFGISGHLTSITAKATHIPEPTVIALLGVGSVALLRRK